MCSHHHNTSANTRTLCTEGVFDLVISFMDWSKQFRSMDRKRVLRYKFATKRQGRLTRTVDTLFTQKFILFMLSQRSLFLYVVLLINRRCYGLEEGGYCSHR